MSFNVFFISYGEINSEENFERLKEFAPHAKHVKDKKGILNAHQFCAKISNTKQFYVVDADNWIHDFDFSYKPPTEQKDFVHNWWSKNPVNDLTYGYGGIKLFPKKALLSIDENAIDVTTSINGFIEHQDVCSTSYFNTTPYDSWKAGFREGTKLALKTDEKSKNRLDTWCNVSNGNYGEYVTSGAQEGRWFSENYPDCLILINDFDFLNLIWKQKKRIEFEISEFEVDFNEYLKRYKEVTSKNKPNFPTFMRENKIQDRTFCPIPWLSLLITQSGTFRACCEMNSPPYGNLKDENDKPYKVDENDWNEIRNDEIMKDLRSKLLSGQRHSLCRQCWIMEDNNSESIRQASREKFDFDVKDAEEVTEKDGKINTDLIPLKYVDLRLGNLCNLKCVTCNPADSSNWYEDYYKLGNNSVEFYGGETKKIENKNNKYYVNYESLKYYEKKGFDEQFFKNINSLERMYFTGGEPMINKKHEEILKYCIDNNLAKNISLTYNTNCTVDMKRFFELWKHFKDIYIALSIDGIGSIVEWVRFPAKWETLNNNIKKLDEYPYNNLNASISTTWSIYNVCIIPEMIEWFESNNFKLISRIETHHMLLYPRFQNMIHYSREAKEKIYSEWKEYLETKDNKESLEKWFSSVYKHLFSKDGQKLQEGINYTKQLDKIRNIDSSKMMPKFYEMIKE